MPKHLLDNQELLDIYDIELFLAQAKTKMHQALIVFQWVYGCRVGELIELRKEDIYVRGKKVIVQVPILKKRTSAVKSEHKLIVPRSTPFMDILLAYVNRLSECAYLFPGRDKGHIRRQIVTRIISRLRHGLYPHFFRHNRINRLIEEGATGPEIMHWAGWSDLRPLKNYSPRRPASVERIT